MGRRSVVATFSIFVHALALLVLMTADLWRPISEWPTPHAVMAFEAPRVVRLDDVPLPSQALPKRKGVSRGPDGPVRLAELAPIFAPPSVGPGTGAPETLVGPIGDGGPIDNPFGGPGDAVPPPPAFVAPPQPKEPIHLHSGIKPPERLVNVSPAYPTVARLARQEGLVIIEATIDERGNVIDTHILRSIPLLDEAALAAVRQWKFSPTQLNGVPVPIVMTVTVNFKLTQ
jgi:protein TonB